MGKDDKQGINNILFVLSKGFSLFIKVNEVYNLERDETQKKKKNAFNKWVTQSLIVCFAFKYQFMKILFDSKLLFLHENKIINTCYIKSALKLKEFFLLSSTILLK